MLKNFPEREWKFENLLEMEGKINAVESVPFFLSDAGYEVWC